jgi:hypothetical protein
MLAELCSNKLFQTILQLGIQTVSFGKPMQHQTQVIIAIDTESSLLVTVQSHRYRKHRFASCFCKTRTALQERKRLYRSVTVRLKALTPRELLQSIRVLASLRVRSPKTRNAFMVVVGDLDCL